MLRRVAVTESQYRRIQQGMHTNYILRSQISGRFAMSVMHVNDHFASTLPRSIRSRVAKSQHRTGSDDIGTPNRGRGEFSIRDRSLFFHAQIA